MATNKAVITRRALHEGQIQSEFILNAVADTADYSTIQNQPIMRIVFDPIRYAQLSGGLKTAFDAIAISDILAVTSYETPTEKP